MRESKSTEEQIIGFLKQAKAGLAVTETCRKVDFLAATLYARAEISALSRD